MATENRSGLTDEELEELEREILRVACDERPSLENKLGSSAIRERLIAEGLEVPDWAMADALAHLRVTVLTTFLGGPQNPNADEEAREHGGITVVGIKYPGICDEV